MTEQKLYLHLQNFISWQTVERNLELSFRKTPEKESKKNVVITQYNEHIVIKASHQRVFVVAQNSTAIPMLEILGKSLIIFNFFKHNKKTWICIFKKVVNNIRHNNALKIVHAFFKVRKDIDSQEFQFRINR